MSMLMSHTSLHFFFLYFILPMSMARLIIARGSKLLVWAAAIFKFSGVFDPTGVKEIWPIKDGRKFVSKFHPITSRR